jgi:hypothetical protein
VNGVRRLLLCAILFSGSLLAQTILDHFENPALWQVQHTDDVTASLHGVDEKAGKALRLDFDFTDAKGNPVNGYATAHRALALDLPDNYELSFRVRGDAPGRSPSAPEAMDGRERPPVNTLQFKLIDASGENVWWLNQTDFSFSHEWQWIRIKQRQLAFAWGPATDHTLRHAASVEFVVSSGRDGGKGSVYFDQLSIRELPADAAPAKPEVRASSALKGFPASAAMDGDVQTAWRSDPAKGSEQHLDIDLGRPREFGGLVLQWRPGEAGTDYDIEFSNDAKHWRTVRRVRGGDGGDDALLLTESETRFVRLALHAGQARAYALNEIEIEDLAWGASPNAFFSALAKDAPRGTYPRGFSEQPYWTIVGVDGGAAPALMSEDGALEPVKGGASIEPFLVVDGKPVTWADVTTVQSLLDGYLPIPRVGWKSGNINLSLEAFAAGDHDASRLIARYHLSNLAAGPQAVMLALAIRPFQVNPPAQFLNSPGGVSVIHDLAWDGNVVSVNGQVRVLPLNKPDDFIASTFDAGSVVERLRAHARASVRSVHDDVGYASSALLYKFTLPAHGEQDIVLIAPMAGAFAPQDFAGGDPSAWFVQQRDAAAASWRKKLNRMTLKLPTQGQRIADALRTAQAHILITRDGAALRPGTRSYARSWIRDGAMIADGLLRLGDIDAARSYVDWYAPHQFASGKVPCCVDHRGSDPVPENDSHGELIHAIAQVYRYGGDRMELEKHWPHVQAAIAYMDGLRASEDDKVNPAFKGLMPASISHEGYSAKPMHSYWDDFWALTGYDDAVDIARALGKADAATRIARARDEFHRDLLASIALAAKAHAIDFIPGSAELGDFDATSTTIALSPAGQQTSLPQDLLHFTFERYWRDFAARSDGSKPWVDYTPYEWRTVGSLVRLGWRDRAQAAIDFFFTTGARPPGWNQWAEVVGHEPRQVRFIGDMPHGWVASDFIRSALDLFAYERDADRALVLAAGVPANWLAGEGVAIADLHTPYGKLGYTLKQNGERLHLRIAAGATPPGGFVFAWPRSEPPGATQIDGKRVDWQGGELHIAAAPAEIIVELSRGPVRH